MSYGDYVEQLTYFLFLKMADEQTRPPFNRPSETWVGMDIDVKGQYTRAFTEKCRVYKDRQVIIYKQFQHQKPAKTKD